MFRFEQLRGVREGDLSVIIAKRCLDKLEKISNVDVVIVGIEVSGLIVAWNLAMSGYKVLVVPNQASLLNLSTRSPYLFPIGVVQEGEPLEIVKDTGTYVHEVKVEEFNLPTSLFLVDYFELTVRLLNKLLENDVSFLINYVVEDLITSGIGSELIVRGVVVNYPHGMGVGLRFPVYINSIAVVDATGYEASLIKLLARKHPELRIGAVGEGSTELWVLEEKIKEIVENSSMVMPGLFLTGGSLISYINAKTSDLIIGTQLLLSKKIAFKIKQYVDEVKQR